MYKAWNCLRGGTTESIYLGSAFEVKRFFHDVRNRKGNSCRGKTKHHNLHTKKQEKLKNTRTKKGKDKENCFGKMNNSFHEQYRIYISVQVLHLPNNQLISQDIGIYLQQIFIVFQIYFERKRAFSFGKGCTNSTNLSLLVLEEGFSPSFVPVFSSSSKIL